VQAPAANGKPPAMSKPAKKAAAPKYVAEPVVEPEDKFELPDAVKHKRAPSSEMTAAEKAAERERQRKAQEEAELKKQRREEQKRQKKEKALKAQEEAEAAAAAAAAAQAAAEAAALKAAAAAAEAEKEAEAAEDAAVAPVMKAASASKVPLPVVKAGAPKPTAKRPARRSQPVQVQLMAYVQEHQMVAAGLAVLLLALLVFRSFTAEPQF